MKELILKNLRIILFSEGKDVRVKSSTENVILKNQSLDDVSTIILNNFNEVSDFYKDQVNTNVSLISLDDVYLISFEIVMYYLYIYNSWHYLYKGQKGKDLRFDSKDFDAPATLDIIFHYFKTKYPDDWEERCSLLTGVELSELKAYYQNRQDYYNK